MKYIELSVKAHPEAVDAIANVFREQANLDVAIEQPVHHDLEGEEKPRLLGPATITAYLPLTSDAAEQEQRIEAGLWHLQAFDLSPISPMARREVDEEDWANLWREHFHPLTFGRVVIKPTWRTWNPSPGEIVVELDPGMAFGTGLHPTTSMMLQALQTRITPGMRVLDLGTGSGILAIPAARLGGRVRALDISEVAVEVARQNVAHNGLARDVEVGLGSIDTVEGQQFDLILANIIASVLVDLAPSLARALAPRGELLASGIIEERADLVRQAFVDAGLALSEQRREGDWWMIAAYRA